MYEDDVSRNDDIGVLLMASGGTLMFVAAVMAALVALTSPNSGFVLSSIV